MLSQQSGRWRLDNGPCVDDYACDAEGSIGASPLEGTVSSPYAYQVAASGTVNDDFSASNLPPGLSMDATGNITGTPTTAGEYRITVTATSPRSDEQSGTCTHTIRATITINEV